MKNRVAAIGDIHGMPEEYSQLLKALEWQSLDSIWHLGDLVDRGPDSAGVIDICIDKKINGVMGNHDQSILNHRNRWLNKKLLPVNPEKQRTLKQLNDSHFEYLSKLPNLHVFDNLNLVLVHAGLWPEFPLWRQPDNVVRAQMIHPCQPGKVRWWGKDATSHVSGKSEEQNRAEGFERWYRIYDGVENVLFGHSTINQPLIYPGQHGNKMIGIDTGSCFGGSISACIFSGSEDFYFISVKAKKVHCISTTRSFWED